MAIVLSRETDLPLRSTRSALSRNNTTRPLKIWSVKPDVRLRHFFADWLSTQRAAAKIYPMEELRRYLTEHHVIEKYTRYAAIRPVLGAHFNSEFLFKVIEPNYLIPRSQLVMDIRTFTPTSVWKPHEYESVTRGRLDRETTQAEQHAAADLLARKLSSSEMRNFALWLVPRTQFHRWQKRINFKRMWNLWRKYEQADIAVHAKTARDVRMTLHPAHAERLLALPSPILVIDLLMALGMDPELDLSLPVDAFDDTINNQNYPTVAAYEAAQRQRSKRSALIPPNLRTELDLDREPIR